MSWDFSGKLTHYVKRGVNIRRFVAVPTRNSSHFHSSRTIQNTLYLTAIEWTITVPDIPSWSRDPSSASPQPHPNSPNSLPSEWLEYDKCEDQHLRPKLRRYLPPRPQYNFMVWCLDGIYLYLCLQWRDQCVWQCLLSLQPSAARSENIRSRSESEVSDLQSRTRRERLSGSAIWNIRHSRMALYKQHTCNPVSQRRHLRRNVCDLHSLPEHRII